MRNALVILVSILVSAIGFRIRGGMFNIGPHSFSRLAWAVPVGAAAAFASGKVEALVIVPFLFAACTLPTFNAIDMGRENDTLQWDAFMTLLRGLVFSLAAAAPLYLLGIVSAQHALAILGIGLFMPMAYELGWRTPSNVPQLERGPAIAEAYFGGFYGLALASALVF